MSSALYSSVAPSDVEAEVRQSLNNRTPSSSADVERGTRKLSNGHKRSPPGATPQWQQFISHRWRLLHKWQQRALIALAAAFTLWLFLLFCWRERTIAWTPEVGHYPQIPLTGALTGQIKHCAIKSDPYHSHNSTALPHSRV